MVFCQASQIRDAAANIYYDCFEQPVYTRKQPGGHAIYLCAVLRRCKCDGLVVWFLFDCL